MCERRVHEENELGIESKDQSMLDWDFGQGSGKKQWLEWNLRDERDRELVCVFQ